MTPTSPRPSMPSSRFVLLRVPAPPALPLPTLPCPTPHPAPQSCPARPLLLSPPGPSRRPTLAGTLRPSMPCPPSSYPTTPNRPFSVPPCFAQTETLRNASI